MKTEYAQIPVKDIIQGYQDNGDDGVIGYDGKLDIRPSYQRAYIHENNPDFRKNLIQSIYNDRPINLIYFAAKGDGRYELLDGQQRIITICRFIQNKFSIEVDGHIRTYRNLDDAQRATIDDYKLHVYFFEGGSAEKMMWFQTINTGAEKLSDQELRNATYNGPWVSDAKRYFTSTKDKNRVSACSTYMDGKRERQEHLEKVIIWKIGSKKNGDICSYMDEHQKDENAEPLWNYFETVIDWAGGLFEEDKSMKKVEWGRLHKEHYERVYDADCTKRRQQELLNDYEVKNKSGVYEYILTGELEEKYLNLRQFDKAIKRKIWNVQERKCNYCENELAFTEAHADHIKPWSEGGKTEETNCQVLCIQCNLKKSNK